MEFTEEEIKHAKYLVGEIANGRPHKYKDSKGGWLVLSFTTNYRGPSVAGLLRGKIELKPEPRDVE